MRERENLGYLYITLRLVGRIYRPAIENASRNFTVIYNWPFDVEVYRVDLAEIFQRDWV